MNSSANIFLFSKTPYPDVQHIPILEAEYLQPSIELSAYDYLIATSKEVFTALDKIGEWRFLKVLAISDATAEMAKKRGAEVLDIAQGYGESIVDLVKEKYSGLKALYPHAKVTAYDVETPLKSNGIRIDSFIVYETLCKRDQRIALPADAICLFTSPSSVRCFEELYGFLPTYKIVCIGETTRSALPEGIESFLAETPSLESTVERARSLTK